MKEQAAAPFHVRLSSPPVTVLVSDFSPAGVAVKSAVCLPAIRGFADAFTINPRRIFKMAHERYHDCIEACHACMEACEHCATACLNEKDVKMMERCIRLDRTCAAICSLAEREMAADSEFAERICQLCAEICDACGEECAKHKMDHCQECAEACRRCAEACREMAGAGAGGGGGGARGLR